MTIQSARLQAVAAAVLFSTGGAAIKVASFSGPQVAAVRSAVAAVALALWVRGQFRLSWQVVTLGAVYGSTLVLFVNATKLTTAADAIFLQSTAPLYVLLLGPLVIGEHIRRRDTWFMVAIVVGMVLCFVGTPESATTAPNPATGDLLGALSGMSWAMTLLLLRRVERDVTQEGAGMTAVVIGNTMASMASLPFGWPLPAAPITEWAWLLYLGTVQIALAYVFLTRAVRRLKALDVSLLLLLEPVLNPVWAWIVRGERPGVSVLLGGAVIVGATAVRSLTEVRRRRDAPSEG